MGNFNLTLSSLILSRSAVTSPYITNNYEHLVIKKSSFNQQISSFIKSPLRNLYVVNTKFRQFLSTAVILDSLTYESTNFSTQNIPTSFNSITSADGLVEFKDVLFYEIQQSYLEACAFQCTSNVNVICNQVSFVNLFLASNTDGTGACFRLEKTKTSTFTKCCFYKVIGVAKASQICGLVRTSTVSMEYCSYNPMNAEATTSPGFYIDNTITNDKNSNYTTFGTQDAGMLYFVNENEESFSGLYIYCNFYNNTWENLTVFRINGNTDIRTTVKFDTVYFYINTQLFSNEGNSWLEISNGYFCKSPFGTPGSCSVSGIGDKGEYGIFIVSNIEEGIMLPFIRGMRAACQVYYRPTETKSIAYPTRSPLPYGNLEFETKEITVNAKVSIFIVSGIIIGIIVITSILIVVTQKTCRLFVGVHETIYLSDDSTDIDEEIYDQEVPILNAEQKRKIARRMSDEFRDLNMNTQENEDRTEEAPSKHKHRRKRVKRRRQIDEESSRGSSRGSSLRSHTHSSRTSRHERSERSSEKTPSQERPIQIIEPTQDDSSFAKAVPRRAAEKSAPTIRPIRSSGAIELANGQNYVSRANHMRVMRQSTGSINPGSNFD